MKQAGRYRKLAVFGFIFWFSFVIMVQNTTAQLVTVMAKLDTNEMTIGDQVGFHLEVRKDRNSRVEFPDLGTNLTDKIEILNKSDIDTSWSEKDQKVILSQKFLITAFDSGLFYIPPLSLPFRSGRITDTLRTAPACLQVHSFPVDSTGTIRDIKGLYSAPVSFGELLPYLLIVLIAGMLIASAIYYFRKKKKNEPVFRRIKPEEPAHIIAMRMLDKLKAEKLWQRGEIKVYYSRLTAILRNYIEKQYNIPAMEQTTDEIIVEFEEQELLDAGDVGLLKEILQPADLVKFAKADPLPDENDACMNKAYEFVKNTRFRTLEFNLGLDTLEVNDEITMQQ